ncbi:MAG: hypothetical protein ACYCXX_00615 [Acidiferrobacter thiooxydans]
MSTNLTFHSDLQVVGLIHPLEVRQRGTTSVADHVAGEVVDHLLDMALPGAGLAAKILGMASQATPAVNQQAPTIMRTEKQERDSEEQERGDD